MANSRLIRIAAFTICCSIGLALLLLLVASETAFGCDENSSGMANPAAVYCQELGYQYKMVDSEQGQYGKCIFPDRTECDAWRFLEGKCGQSHSYCAEQGYGLITKTDGKNPFSREYSVCVDDQQEIGAVTELMDLREKATRGTSRLEQTPDRSQHEFSRESPPASFDWRNHDGQDWMTPVKDQGNCGSCWAFSAVGVVEAIYNVTTSNPNLDLDLSEEYLVSDCYTHPSYSMNCCGGANDVSFEFIRDSGIPDEGCMPYADSGCTCPGGFCSSANCTYYSGNSCSDRTCPDRCSDWQSRLAQISATGGVPSDQTTIKQNLVDGGPLGASMNMSGSFDGNNIYRCTSTSLQHDVVLAGYDDAGGYWIVKNSWGATWGPDSDGYFKVGYGECAIETLVSYATVTTPPVSAVGGIAELPVVAGDSSAPVTNCVLLAALAAATPAAFAATAWYARRRLS